MRAGWLGRLDADAVRRCRDMRYYAGEMSTAIEATVK